MPLTVPTHPAAVLPLKVWRPRWFDGVALAVGSAAPDLAYALDGSGLRLWPLSHQVRGLLLWCLPITLAVAWLIRRAAPALARHLPEAGRLALGDYGALGHGGHRWPVTALSALVGAASHLVLDRFESAVPPAENVMHILGAVGLLAVLRWIGGRRLIRRWHGDPPPVRPRPALFWTVAAAVTLPALTAVPFLPAAWLVHVTAVRLFCLVVAGLLIASFVASAGDRPIGAAQRRRRGDA